MYMYQFVRGHLCLYQNLNYIVVYKKEIHLYHFQLHQFNNNYRERFTSPTKEREYISYFNHEKAVKEITQKNE